MNPMNRSVMVTAAVSLALQTIAFGDATVQRKTKVNFGGAIGKIAGVFGGKAVRDGVVSTTTLAGGVKLDRHDRFGELINLKAETVAQIDFDKQTYSVKTFEQIRKELEEQLERMREAQDSGGAEEKATPSDVQFELTLDVKETGRKEKIADYDCREVVITATIHQKGKPVEAAGGSVVTLSMWLGPELAAIKEIENFDLAYAKALKLQELAGQSAQQMASALAMYPQMQQAITAIQNKRVDMRGTAIRTVMIMEAVPAPGAETADGGESSEEPKSLGGLFGKMASKLGKKKGEANPDYSTAPTAAGRVNVMTSTTEILSAAATASAADLSLPAGFKLKN